MTTPNKPAVKEVTAGKKTAPKSVALEVVEVVPTPPRKKAMLGSIVFIAAGPGDPELLTMRAVRLLEKADKIVADVHASHIAATYVNEDKVVIAVGEDEQELEPAEAAKLVLELERESE